VFETLKDHGAVWKSWHSAYNFKCQIGEPISSIARRIVNKKIHEQIHKEYLKFYLHFTKVPSVKDAFDSLTQVNSESEYCVSFIWIRGGVQKYLSLITDLRSSIEEKMA